ncbi:unnamed protein product [Clonostachys byssicola]|uniref:Cell division cycle protein 123 n=1 Tax=Clonostachys byssicola TaxID=160290 RepID=A0A9N9UH90_9HYPO|nr:unnamed protein product [Clonostachys byssicola]
MPTSIKFSRINYDAVEEDIKPGPPTRFNSRFCDEKLLPPLERPNERPYGMQRWLPAVLESRELDPATVQFVRLSRRQGHVLLEASGNAMLTGQFNRATVEKIREEVYPAFSELFIPSQGLFVRLEFSSPKDATPQNMILSPMDVCLRLATSQMAMSEMRKTLLSGSLTVKLIFFPYNPRIRIERQYRVYCQPDTGRVTAISQQDWSKKWRFAELCKEEQNAVVEEIWMGIWKIHQAITGRLDIKTEMDALMLKQGFTFDVYYDEDSRKVMLIDLGVFGANGSCGSCLFEWVHDFGLLYGMRQSVEFRATY